MIKLSWGGWMSKPPLCGDPGKCLRRSKRCSYDCVISRHFKSGKAARDLLLKEDEIDETSLTRREVDVLTENHRKSMKWG